MTFHSFIHSDGSDISNVFRSNVKQFVNDKESHPIVKYQAFLVMGLMVVIGLMILLLFNGNRIFAHSYWKHLFQPQSDDIHSRHKMSDAAIFRKAVEGMTTTTTTTTTKDGKVTTSDGKFVSADTEAAEKKKKTPCATDCGNYIELKGKINDLTKYVNAVKDQKDEIKQTEKKLEELGKQIQDLNSSLSPGGQLNITI
jgi:polyhydroxyalkanoate synthesis regulator phasin